MSAAGVHAAAGNRVNSDRVPVLMYHRIDDEVAPHERAYCLTPGQFTAQLDWLRAKGWKPCAMADFARWFDGAEALPERSVLITFDDGFAGLHRHALPALQQRGFPATVFLVSALVGRRDLWTAREFGAGAGHALLDRSQIAEMARHGIDFHSHSRSHADLTSLDDAELADQVAGSRAELQDLLGRPVDHFAYPFGRVDARVKAAVRAAGYRLAFSVDPGFNRPRGEPLAVRRLDITGLDSASRFGRKVTLGSNDGSLGYRLRYLGRRLAARLLG